MWDSLEESALAKETEHQLELMMGASPHIKAEDSVPMIMYTVALALLPSLVCAIYYFGFRALALTVVTIVAAMVAEAVIQKLRGQAITIWDGSALVTGLLLAFNLPPALPYWMAIVGAVVAIFLGKQIFGGLGQNPFNPALIGRVFLSVAFPAAMTTWTWPFDGLSLATPYDAFSQATPLMLMKSEGVVTSYLDLFLGNVPGCLGETCTLALLVGAGLLLYKRYIDWRIPVGYLGTVFLLTWILGQDPVFHLLAGGLILGAFFMATDMVSSPMTKTGRWIFGIGAGIILVLIRLYGAYPEGVSFSILLMNAVTPMLNHYTKPRIFGEVKKHV